MKRNDMKKRLALGRDWFYCRVRKSWHKTKVRVLSIEDRFCEVVTEDGKRYPRIPLEYIRGPVEPYFYPVPR